MASYDSTLLGNIVVGGNNTTTPLKLIYDAAGVNNVEFQVSPTGNLTIVPSGGTLSFGISQYITTTTSPQLQLAYSGSVYTNFYTNSTGYLNIQATGTYVDFNSANQVRITNTTASTTTATGCMILSGGLGVAGAVYAARVNALSTTTPQLYSSYSAAVYTSFSTSSAGNMTVQATGTYVDFNSANIVRVLNTTASSSTITGCLVLSGGLGVLGQICASRVNAITPTQPQLYVSYSTGIYNNFSTDSSGNMTIDGTGTYTIHTGNFYVDAASTTYRVFGRLSTSYSATWTGPWTSRAGTVYLEKWGSVVYAKFDQTVAAATNTAYVAIALASFLPAAYRPANNILLPTTVLVPGASQLGSIYIMTTGQVNFYEDMNGGTFTNGWTQAGFTYVCHMWVTATTL